MDREGRGSEWLGGGEECDQNTFEIVINNKNIIKFNKFLSSFSWKTKKNEFILK